MTNEEIKQLRESLNLSQQKFATLVGVSTVTVNRWERGIVVPAQLSILRLKQLGEKKGG